MPIEDADRPDPASGRGASEAYAEAYARSHREIADEAAYRAGYADLLLIDKMFSGYRMLYVGAGTGGFLRLVTNHASITALDYSPAMIEKAQELRAELGIERVDFVCRSFEEFEADGLFDIVHLASAAGWYRPWPGNEGVLRKAHAMLRDSGVAVAAYVRPRTLADAGKAVLAPRRTVVVTRAKFLAIAAAAGFEQLLSLETGRSSLAFLRKRAG